VRNGGQRCDVMGKCEDWHTLVMRDMYVCADAVLDVYVFLKQIRAMRRIAGAFAIGGLACLLLIFLPSAAAFSGIVYIHVRSHEYTRT